MSRTIRMPPSPAPADRKKADNSALLASVVGEEDPGAALDAPVPPPRAPLKDAEGDSPGEQPPGPSRPSRSS